jgi:2,4-dienoyl-CoA reductase-like NADH-dependent reductase (Old Yellow Enzyme family)
MASAVSSEFSIGKAGLTIRNRTVLAAMTNKQSHEDGTLSDEEISWLLMRAEGGFGIVTTAASHVHPNGKSWEGEMGVWSDHHIPRLNELASGIRERGAISLIQLFHGGLRAPRSLTGEQPSSASENFEKGVEEKCRELSNQEISNLVASFGEAARRSEEAGFDGVEVHGAHGYLICQFLGSRTNRRQDKWGGDLGGRSLFLKEILSEIRRKTTEDFLICVRISPEHEVGVTLRDSLSLSVMMRDWGVDILHISCWDAFTGAKWDTEDSRTITRRFRETVGEGFPIISTGSVWTESDAEFVLDEGADMVGVARVGIAHSDWASRLGEGGYEPSRPPFSSDHLLNEGLSPIFIDYMRRWKDFVEDGRK